MEQNLSLYYIFNIVAQKGNISLAAKELYISQPAISKSIQKLETNLNTTLFKRTSRGVSLTYDGELLYKYTQEAFSTLKSGEETLARNQHLGISQLRIGVSNTLCKYILLPYLQQFISTYPHVRISISCQPSHQTLALLEEQKIDIGLIAEPDNTKSIYFQPLQKIQDTFVSAPSYLENLKMRVDSGNIYQSATFMMLNEENITRKYVDQVFDAHKVEPEHILEITSMDLLIEFAKIGLGVACVIKEFVKDELNKQELVEIIPEINFQPRQIGFACRNGEQVTTVIHNFLNQ